MEDTAAIVRALADQLADASKAEPAATFPRRPAPWTSRASTRGVRRRGPPRPLRAVRGALATVDLCRTDRGHSFRSHSQRITTLRDRIGGNHLHGNVGSFTLRQALTAVLIRPLELRLAGTASTRRATLLSRGGCATTSASWSSPTRIGAALPPSKRRYSPLSIHRSTSCGCLTATSAAPSVNSDVA